MRRLIRVMLVGLPAIVAAALFVAYQVGSDGTRQMIPLPQLPVAVIVDTYTARAFVGVPATAGGGLVYVLDTKNGSLLRTVSLGPGAPVAMALDQRAGRLVVIDDAVSDNVQVLDAVTGAVRQHDDAGITPAALAVDERTGRAFIVNRGSDSVSILDIRSGRLLGTTAVGFSPQQIAVDERTDRAFVTTEGDVTAGQLWMLDATTGQLLHTTELGQIPGALPAAMAVDTRRARVFVATGPDTVSMFDASSGRLLRSAMVGMAPVTLAVDEAAGRIFAGLSQSSGISVLEAQSGRLLRTVSSGQTSSLMAPVAPVAGDRAVEVDATDGTLDIVDARRGTLMRTIHVGAPAIQALQFVPGPTIPVTVDTGSSRIYVAVPGPLDAAGVAATMQGSPIYDGPGHVLAIDARSGALLEAPVVGVTPMAAAVDDRARRLIVLDGGGDLRMANGWLQWLHQHVPWVPASARQIRVIPPSISLLSLPG